MRAEFIATHHDAFLQDMGTWVREGQVRYIEDVVRGLARAPEENPTLP